MRSACASTPSGENDFRRHVVWNTHTMDSISRDSPTPKRPKTSDKRPWDFPGAFSYAVYAMQIPLEGSLVVFLGYVLVFQLSLFDFRANAALNRLSEALRLSQPSDFRATPRLPATLGERLSRRLSDSPTIPDSQRLHDSLRLSDYQRLSTFDLRGARHPHTMRRDPARNTGTPRGRRNRTRRFRNDRPHRG